MYGYVYLTTNLINGKKYIGRHKSNAFDETYLGSGKIIQQALLKEGVENFSCQILCVANSEEELNKKEAYYIDLYNAVNSSDYYNLKPGGIGKSVKGFIIVNNGLRHKYIFPEELQNYIEQGYVLGKLSPTKETIDKRAKSNTGKKRTEQTKQKISNALKGKPLSPEHKIKCSYGRLGKPSYNKGMIQITNGLEYKFVHKEDLHKYLNAGYIKKGKPHSIPSHKKGKIAVNKNNHTEYIFPNQLNDYISNGYTKGSCVTYKRNSNIKHHWYTNGNLNIMLNETDKIPEGYKKGRTVTKKQNK